MILDRILKGFWGRYALYLSAFVALYFLMREKLDSIIFGLWDSWITVGEHPHISLYLFCLLSLYPIYRMLKYDKKKQMVDAAHVAYLFIPISIWYLIQRIWVTNEISRFSSNTPLVITFCFTVTYSLILILLWLKRPRIDHESKKSLLLLDIPEKDIKEDKLGFASYVDRLAKQIIELHQNEKSFVLGIEGGWGSGKSTFANFLKNEVTKDKTITVVEFNPWMRGDTDGIVRDFFNRLAESIPSIHLRTKFREYGKALAKIEELGVAGKILEYFCSEPDLKSQQDEITDILKRLDLKLVVFIDDLDRLDKDELMAVLKLIRNTGDLYQTTYIINFHRRYVEDLLKIHFESNRIGETYLDKIINLEYKLPRNTDLMSLLVERFKESEAGKKKSYDVSDTFPPEIKVKFNTVRKLKKVYNTVITEFNFDRYYNVSLNVPIVFYYLYFYEIEAFRRFEKAVKISKDPLLRSNLFGDTSFWDYSECKIIREIYYSLFNTKESSSDSAGKLVNTQHNAIIDYILSDNNSSMSFENKEIPLYFLAHLLKLDSTQSSETNYFELKNKYGDDGFKGVNLNLQNTRNIIDRLNSLKSDYNSTYSSDRSQFVYMLFIRERESDFKKEYKILEFYKFSFALLMFMENYASTIDLIVQSMKLENYGQINGAENVLNILDEICDDEDNRELGYIGLFSTISLRQRFSVVSQIYTLCFSYIFDNISSKTFPFDKEMLLEKAHKHLTRAIEKAKSGKLHYLFVENALLSCWNSKNRNHVILDSKAIWAFKEFIKSYPDGFIVYFFRVVFFHSRTVVFHPFSSQLFNMNERSKDFLEFIINSEILIRPENKEALDILRNAFWQYTSNKDRRIEEPFTLDPEDYDRLFYLEDGEIKRKIFIPDPEDIKGHV